MEDFEIRIPQPGERYLHYKGGYFEVITIGRLSEQRDQIMIVYKSLDRGHVWIRPLGMWGEYVELEEGHFFRLPNGQEVTRVPRFRLFEQAPDRP